MEALRLNELEVKKIKLEAPALDKIVEVLSKELKKNFSQVEVSVVECPDLSMPPFNLASKGLCGNPSVIQVCDPSNVVPITKPEKIYDFRDVSEVLNLNPAFIIGAGGGCWPSVGRFCEVLNFFLRLPLFYSKEGTVGPPLLFRIPSNMCANLTITNKKAQNFTHEMFTTDKTLNGIKVQRANIDETRFSALGNLFVSRGDPGKVIRVLCKSRTGPDDFPLSVRNALNTTFTRPIALGVVFLMRSGEAEHHIVPEFAKIPVNSTEELLKWFLLPSVKAPFTSLGTILTTNPDGWSMQTQHFHSYGAGNSGGHYHFDVTPEEAVYEAYMLPAEMLCAVDQPTQAISLFYYDVNE